MSDLLSFMIDKGKEEVANNANSTSYQTFSMLLLKSSIIDIIMILVDKT